MESNVIAREALAHEIAARENISFNKANSILKTTLSLVSEKLEEGYNVRLTDFGTFTQTTRAARNYRIPKTGEIRQKDERRAVRFNASTRLKDKLNQ